MARYYLCPYRDPVRAGGQGRRCPERRIRADELDSFVFEQVRDLLARPDLLAAGEAALLAQQPAPDDHLVAAQLARIDWRIETGDTERRRLADLDQDGVIDETEMAGGPKNSKPVTAGSATERQAFLEQRSGLAQHNRLNQRISAFAQRALAGLDTTNFDKRQQLLRLVLEDVRVEGWQVELRLCIPWTKIYPTTRPCRRPHHHPPKAPAPEVPGPEGGSVKQ